MELSESARLCTAFSRCMNYPRDEEGAAALARGLARAAQTTGVAAESIVENCLENSMYCPSDAELLEAARGIRGPDPVEDIPHPRSEVVRKQWQALAHQFPTIMENGKVWQVDFKAVCGKIRQHMGADKWATATSREKVRVGIEMGLKVHVRPPSGQTLEDMGVGIFVAKLPL